MTSPAPKANSGKDGRTSSTVRRVLLAAVALGLAAYGVFCFFDARYHRV